MNYNPIAYTYECCECEREIELTVWPIIPAKLFGPPEQCHPAEGGEVEPDECPHCGAKIDTGIAYEKAMENWNDNVIAAYEAKWDTDHER